MAKTASKAKKSPKAEKSAKAKKDAKVKQAKRTDKAQTDVLKRIGKEQALDMLEDMALIRRFEMTANLRYLQGEIPGTLHQSQGQEAVPVGVSAHLTDADWITSTHRPHGHALAKGIDAGRAMAEIYGRETGCLGGRGGSMHLGDDRKGVLPSLAIVGAGLTIAPGLAWGLQRKGEDSVVVCYFGDGAVNEGAFHEGVNYASVKGLPVVFVCENNLYGASTPWSETTLNVDIASRAAAYGIPGEQLDGMDVTATWEAAGRAIKRARAGDGPTLLECLTYRYVGHSRSDTRGYRTKDEEQEWKDRDPIDALQAKLIEAGLATEEETKARLDKAKERIAEALSFAQSAAKPAPESAVDPHTVYGAPPQRVDIGEVLEDGDEERYLTIAEALREGISEELAADETVMLLGEDVGVPGGFGGAFGVYAGLAEEHGRDRIVDTPISEKAIMGVSIGGAITGLKTLPDLQYGDFVFEMMDEIANEGAKLRYMSGGEITVPTVLRCPVGATERGAQHSQCPESLFLNIPGVKVLCISDPYTAKGAIRAALRDPDPVLVFEHKLLYGSKKRQEPGSVDARVYVPEEEYVLPVGQARRRRAGSDVTVVATFRELYRALQVADELAGEIELDVIDPVWLSPMDTDGIIDSVRRTKRLVIAHESHRTGGWGAELAAHVGETLHGELLAPVRRVASRDVPMPFAPWLEEAVLPSAAQLKEAVQDVMQYSKATKGD